MWKDLQTIPHNELRPLASVAELIALPAYVVGMLQYAQALNDKVVAGLRAVSTQALPS
jgi:hypothetical protein